MNITQFYLQIIDSFNQQQVDYMLVGGHAVNYYGYVRSTLDMDIWVDTTDDNLLKLQQALIKLGYSVESCKQAIAYLRNKHIFKIPKESVVIDILDSFILKHDFESVYKHSEKTEIDGICITVIGIDDLIEIKQKSNRMKDILDAQELTNLKNLQLQEQIKNQMFLDSNQKRKK